ncbi:fimbrial protein [Variovorax boronicumulans]|uniref:fimbrial protein n=1 Tax=Variovorax boronicumulans TaxID=436515 RepID=UPI00214C9428
MKRSRFFLWTWAGDLLCGARSIGMGVLLLGALGSPGAWAACVKDISAIPQTIDIGMGNVIIRDDVPLNGVIATRRFTVQPILGWFCRTAGTLNAVVLQGTPLPSDSTIYATAVPGVGIRVSEVQGSYPFQVATTGPRFYVVSDRITVALIKTAAVTGTGSLTAGIYTQMSGDGDNVSLLTTTLSAKGTTLVAESCAVDLGSRNIPVQFGKVSQTEFRGLGTSAAERSFNIQLNCRIRPGGLNTVMLRMDAQTDTPATPGVLSLTAGTGTARGVGIQILDGSKVPVKFGETADVGPAKNGSYVLPYTARYYQTATTVTAGQANGTATFTLDYR